MASLELTEQPAMTMQEERLARNFAEFEHYVLRAQGYLAQGELATAAAHCAIASHIATQNHCGIFWSPRLEKVLTDIGRAVPTTRRSGRGCANWRQSVAGSASGDWASCCPGRAW